MKIHRFLIIAIAVVISGCPTIPPNEVVRGPTLTKTIDAIKYEINEASKKLDTAYTLEGASYFYRVEGSPGEYVQVSERCACTPAGMGEEFCPYTKKRPKIDLRQETKACLSRIYNEADRIEILGQRPPLAEVKSSFVVSTSDSEGFEITIVIFTLKSSLSTNAGTQISFIFSPTPIAISSSNSDDKPYLPFPESQTKSSVAVNGLSKLIVESVSAISNADSSVSPFCWENFTVSAWLEATSDNSLELINEWSNGSSVSLDSADGLGVKNKVELVYKMPKFDGKEIVCKQPMPQ